MKSITTLSIMLIALLIGGPAWADDEKILLSSDNNTSFGANVAAALDCGMPASADATQKKYDRMSASAKARYNARWKKKLKSLVYKSFDHQYSRSQVNDMSTAELARILRVNPHMVGTMQNRPGRCSSGTRVARKKVKQPDPVAAPVVAKVAPPEPTLWEHALALNKHEVAVATYELKKERKAELAAAEKAKVESAKNLALANSAVGTDADQGRKDALVKAQKVDQDAAERVKKAKLALSPGGEA